MIDRQQAQAEFCFLGFDHWSICMTKAEWASWAQVLVGLIAIYAAVRAVRAAHELSRQALQQDRQSEDVAIVEAEEARFIGVLNAVDKINEKLATGGVIDFAAVRRLRILALPLLQ